MSEALAFTDFGSSDNNGHVMTQSLLIKDVSNLDIKALKSTTQECLNRLLLLLSYFNISLLNFFGECKPALRHECSKMRAMIASVMW